MAGIEAQEMGRLTLTGSYKDKVLSHADKSASVIERGQANLEDDFRDALDLLKGYEILEDGNATDMKAELEASLNS